MSVNRKSVITQNVHFRQVLLFSEIHNTLPSLYQMKLLKEFKVNNKSIAEVQDCFLFVLPTHIERKSDGVEGGEVIKPSRLDLFLSVCFVHLGSVF